MKSTKTIEEFDQQGSERDCLKLGAENVTIPCFGGELRDLRCRSQEVTQEIGMAHSITIQLVFLFPGNNQETEPRIKEDIKFCFVDVVQIPTPLFVENFAI